MHRDDWELARHGRAEVIGSQRELTDNSVADGKNQRPLTPRAEGELTPNNFP